MTEHTNPEHQTPPAEADVFVDMGEWAQTHGEQTIGTTSLASCAGIALYDPSNRVGYMLHTYATETWSLENMLESVRAAANPAELRVWVAGAVKLPDVELIKETERFHNAVLTRLERAGITEDNVSVEWGDDPYGGMEMILDSATGECRIMREKESAGDDFYDDYDDFTEEF